MKPTNIFIIRHGESEGNVDKTIYSRKADYALDLTENGREQAKKAALKLNSIIEGKVEFYTSSWYRARQTCGIIQSYFYGSKIKEDPRLREQEWSGKLPTENNDIGNERDEFGHFYYRFNGGESAADVFDRISTFLETLYRDFNKIGYPENLIIVGHGMTNRVLLMRWLHWTVEEFELVRNPKNCEFYQLQLENDKYKLISELNKDTSLKRIY